MPDRTSKILLAVIALGLWGNVFAFLLRSNVAVAQYETDHILRSVDAHLANIDGNIDRLQKGSCPNGKLCF